MADISSFLSGSWQKYWSLRDAKRSPPQREFCDFPARISLETEVRLIKKTPHADPGWVDRLDVYRTGQGEHPVLRLRYAGLDDDAFREIIEGLGYDKTDSFRNETAQGVVWVWARERASPLRTREGEFLAVYKNKKKGKKTVMLGGLEENCADALCALVHHAYERGHYSTPLGGLALGAVWGAISIPLLPVGALGGVAIAAGSAAEGVAGSYVWTSIKTRSDPALGEVPLFGKEALYSVMLDHHQSP